MPASCSSTAVASPPTDLADAAAEPEVCAVVVWSGRFGGMDSLPSRLDDLGFEVAQTYGEDDDRVLYLKPDCSPS